MAVCLVPRTKILWQSCLRLATDEGKLAAVLLGTENEYRHAWNIVAQGVAGGLRAPSPMRSIDQTTDKPEAGAGGGLATIRDGHAIGIVALAVFHSGGRETVMDVHDNVLEPDTRPERRPNRRRRQSDMISIAFHIACDQGDLEAADKLLAILEFMLRRPPPAEHPERRVDAHPLVAAHERLWTLRHPETRDI
jgi:hypothetical protein